MDQQPPIRVTVVQPSLAKYRIPVFQELASRPGLDVKIVHGALEGLENVAPEGFRAIPTKLRTLRLVGKPVMLQRAHWSYATRRHSDVLVLQWSGRHITVLPALLRARLNGVATVLWGHGYSKSPDRPRTKLHQWLARFATALLFYDPRTRDEYIGKGWNSRNLFVALNSLEHRTIVEARRWWIEHPQQLESFRQEHRLGQGPVILFVSRLQRANHVDWLIHATAELAREMPGVKTVIIGNGAAERRGLMQLTHDLHVEDRVLFLDGIYDEMKLAPWFLVADAFCYPANVGLSLLHALWYGLPVVTTNNLACQNPEIVALEHGVNGLTYEHGNTSALADALRQIVADEGMRKTMSQAARRSVEDRLTIRQMIDGMEAAIRYANQRMRLARHG